MLNIKLYDNVNVTEVNTDNVNLGLAELQVEMAEANVVYGNESISVANLYLDSERLKYDLSELTPGTESFMSAVMHGIETMFKKVIDFMSNIFKYIFKLFKRIYDFIMGFFKSRDKSGGGGGSVRDRVEKKKDKVEDEIEEAKKQPTKNSPNSFNSYIDKYTNRIAKGISSHNSFFSMPLKHNDKIDVQDIIFYLDTVKYSYNNVVANITTELLSDSINIFSILLSKGKKSTVFKIIEDVINEYEIQSKYNGKNAASIHNAVTNELRGNIERIKEEITDISELLTSITNESFSNFNVMYNNKLIPVPDNIKAKHDEEDGLLENDVRVIRSLVSVTKTKFSYLKIMYDTKLQQEVEDNLNSAFEAWDEESAIIVSKEKALLEVFKLLESATRAFSVSFKTYDTTTSIYGEDELREMIKDITITDSAYIKILSDASDVYEHIEDDSSKYIKKNKKLLSEHENRMDEMKEEVKLIARAGNSYSKAVDKDDMGDFRELMSTINKIVTNVNNNTITPLNNFLGITKDTVGDGMKYLATDFDEKYLENHKSNYSMLNLIVDLYSLKRMQAASILHS